MLSVGAVELKQRLCLRDQVGARSQDLISSSTLACAWASPMLSLLTFFSLPFGVFKTSSHCVASTGLNSPCRTAWHGTHRFLLASASFDLGLGMYTTWPDSLAISTPTLLSLSSPCVFPHSLWRLTFEMMFNVSPGGMTTGHSPLLLVVLKLSIACQPWAM